MKRVADAGVGHVFLVTGGAAMHLNDAVGLRNDIEYVPMLHEQAAAIAAEAYARVTNNLGVVLVTSGPGGTNALTGVAGAWLESTPCLVISGQVKRADLKGSLPVRQLGPQELDIVTVVTPITKYARTVMDPSEIAYEVDKCLHLARTGRPGPVWLDMPLDVQATDVDVESLRRYEPPDSSSLRDENAFLERQIDETIGLLNGSDRPIVLVGNGVRLARAQADLLEAIEVLDVPVLATWMGADLLWETHPRYFGKPGVVASRGANFALQNCDLLVSIGARLDVAITGFEQSECARGAKKVVVDIDPGEIEKLRMQVDVPVCADALKFIQGLLQREEAIHHKDRREWFERCAQWKARYPIVTQDAWDQTGCANTYAFASALADELTGDDLIIPGSSGVGIDTFWLAFRMKQGQRVFSTGGLGAMGFGLPAAIGGCLASGAQRTISVDGDGGFQLNIQELQTVARLGLPIKFFVLSNEGYASIRATQHNYFDGRLVGSDPSSCLTLPDLARVSAAYGLASYRIDDNDGLVNGIREVLDHAGPAICEVVVEPNQRIGPRVSSALRSDGTMVSRPLEDLFPFLDREELRANMIVPMLDNDAR